VGAFLVLAGVVVLARNMVASFTRGDVAGDNPWSARTLEWLVSSPPPEHDFDQIPEVLDRPHMHGVSGSVHARVGPDREEGAEEEDRGPRRQE